MSHNESLESPLVSDNLVLNEIIGTAWYSIDSIVAAHDAGSLAITHTGLECWEISLPQNGLLMGINHNTAGLIIYLN